MEDRWGTADPGATERLAALRRPAAPAAPASEAKPRGVSREVGIGVILVLAGIIIGSFVLLRDAPTPPAGPVAAAGPVVPPAAGPGKGEMLVAALVEQGHFPPATRQGALVRVVVGDDGGENSRMIPGTATVNDIAPSDATAAASVVTLAVDSGVAHEIAAASTVRLVLVGGEDL